MAGLYALKLTKHSINTDAYYLVTASKVMACWQSCLICLKLPVVPYNREMSRIWCWNGASRFELIRGGVRPILLSCLEPNCIFWRKLIFVSIQFAFKTHNPFTTPADWQCILRRVGRESGLLVLYSSKTRWLRLLPLMRREFLITLIFEQSRWQTATQCEKKWEKMHLKKEATLWKERAVNLCMLFVEERWCGDEQEE